ncbi:hypothetical protein BSYN_17270 [Bacteroides sedimenti]|uniref:Uncharacterized protein n=2 Tax=Bacteroides sedimenti TaxID=2136147 RepID=A0ABM8IIP1_9BACE
MLTVICLFCYGQTNKFIVITFSSKRSIDKEFKNYYWITPVDSIKSNDFYLTPLYVAEFSKDNLDDCIKGDTIDIFTSTSKTRLDFDSNYDEQIENLIFLIDKNRVKVQSIKMNWDKRKWILVNIYATPITGNFCDCYEYHNRAGTKFNSMVYLPQSGFSYDKSFWDTPISNIVRFSKYNFIDYTSHLLYKRSVQTRCE